MKNQFATMPDQGAWSILVGAAKRALADAGFALHRVPGRGRSNVWEIEQKGRVSKVSIRTTKDRWFAFPPLKRGSEWKTLDHVDQVIVAAVDDPQEPKKVEVYLFDAGEVRKRFDASYAARTKAGLVVKDNFGMWVALDTDKRRLPASVGSGLADEHEPIAVYPVGELMADADAADIEPDQTEEAGAPQLGTIGEVMGWARQRIAALSGVQPEAVKLDLKIEY
jgi:hypothetical protein